ncbi:MAG: 50S ribosomal protein L29 [Saprospiraceae bacterium]|nr:50S ribosomal protein L29 [Saprospiraceae bacterium]MCC7505512.1 50S ribosomal protein L29 [Saprospiraceae bacterium]
MAKEKLDLSDKNVAELQADLGSAEQEYQQLKFDNAVRGIPNPMELRELRRKIARIHTELRSREMSAMSEDELALRSKLRARRRRQR